MDFIIGVGDQKYRKGDKIRHLISGKKDIIADFLNEENVITLEGKTWHVCNIELVC